MDSPEPREPDGSAEAGSPWQDRLAQWAVDLMFLAIPLVPAAYILTYRWWH